MWERDHAARAAGAEIVEARPGHARVRLRVRADMVNGHGIAHGGYVFLLADTAFAYACNTERPPAVARSCHIEFLAPAREGDVLEAEATERMRAERNGIYDVAVRRAADAVLVAEFRGHSRQLGQGFALASEEVAGRPPRGPA
jgi:acyl-CoA thioesterase